MLELQVCVVVRFAGFASCCCQDAKTPPKRVERSTVKLLALFKDRHGAMGVPAGCGVGKSWSVIWRFTSVAKLILVVDYGRACWQSKIRANHNRGNILVSYFGLTIASLVMVGIVTYCHHYIFMMCVIFFPHDGVKW